LAILAVTVLLTGTRVAAREKLLYSFYPNGRGGLNPEPGLISDAAGNFYGTTTSGGADGVGTVFELTPKAGGGWTEKVLHTFKSNGRDGNYPLAGVIFDASGNLYGTTPRGGIHNAGTVFQLTPGTAGGWVETVLYSFHNGPGPVAGLIVDAAGNLYGTTQHGGAYLLGAVFELTPRVGGGWTKKVLHSFNSSRGDGILPSAGVIFDTLGNLYGTTSDGGVYGTGTVFELTPTAGGGWTERVLHNFTNDGKDGQYPFASLIFDAAGNLYSTTNYGGSGACSNVGCGTVFELMPKAGGGWTEKVLHSFNSKDGQWPSAGVIFDAVGNLYGTTPDGGAFGYGIVFKLTTTTSGRWKEQVLQTFNGKNGQYPNGGLSIDGSGNLYGTTVYGGAHGYGTAFEITP
jgi:uncharacterized repeat protein (TIGR03803 family)